MKPVIQLTNLKKTYGDITTVNLEKLTVYEGEIYGFLGPNGAGKSTTMKMILSLLTPTAGEIKIEGKSIIDDKEYLTNIGSMIEEPSYYPNLTAYENLSVLQKMLNFDEKNIQSTLKLVGLLDEKNKRKLVKDFSLGMKQRLALAFALVKHPKILLLDEPTNGLDPAGIHEIRELIINLAKKTGLTIFISSHILSEIEQIADRVGIINSGKLVYEGKIEEIKSNRWIEICGDFSKDSKIIEVLKQSEVEVISLVGNKLKIKDITDLMIGKLVKLLVDSGYSINHVSREKESLEDIFLSMTKGKGEVL
ncbi:ABC-2 type transport system ATP-binding protein [Streptococcus equinus]|uniref:ABC-2 type transport system ATP-binding protein n=1 Tax=Streptococcus equinus TaxID=1335 RepID=A0A1H0PDH6_STREI|nr:ATP-binding cassette domain-containing protein [Streptococcus equinus]SDP03054.1 ABC-2 type transport system ATP-binding protein [Streptococcus equinus]